MLWSIGALAVKRRPLSARIFAFVAGSDNRLSLSRLQAFGWTLVIFGSFAAAMMTHAPISGGGDAAAKRRQSMAKTAFDTANGVVTSMDSQLRQLQQLLAENRMAQATADVAASVSKSAAAAASGTEKDPLQKKADENQKTAAGLAAQRAGLESAIQSATAERERDERSRATAEDAMNSASTDWVKIPPQLLALGGIAIAAGLFSSLISAMNDESKSACVTRLSVISAADLKGRFPDADAQPNSSVLLIEGVDFGKAGRVRINNQQGTNLYWGQDGTIIATEMPRVNGFKVLVVETPHGKLAYDVSGDPGAPVLGLPRFVYDIADLFRDDKTPSIFSLMKFQMFGWTVVAIGIYTVIFLMNLTRNCRSCQRWILQSSS